MTLVVGGAVNSDNFSNFTPPPTVPDFFGQSVTPGSQTQVPIVTGTPGLAPVGTGLGPSSTDPNASFTFDPPASTQPSTDPTAPMVLPGGLGGGLDPGTLGNPSGDPTATTVLPGGLGGGLDPGTLANPSGDPTAPLTGVGNPVTQAGQGLTAIGGFLGNWFVRAALIALGIVLVAAAAWELTKERTANA